MKKLIKKTKRKKFVALYDVVNESSCTAIGNAVFCSK